MAKFNTYFEAVDDQGYPGGWHPSKRDRISGDNRVDEILPDLGPNSQKYLEYVASESYKKIVERLSHYLQIDINQLNDQYPTSSSYMSLIFGVLNEVMQIEQHHLHHLEELALHAVLQLPEFSMIREMYEDDILQFDISITPQPDLSRAIGEADAHSQLNEDELSPTEELTLELSDDLQDEEDLKREFANFITQGNAVSKLYLFNTVSSELETIDPTLPAKYGILTAVIQILYFAMPHIRLTQAMGQAAAMGSEEVDRNNHIIKAQGTTFPYLVHEIVKGIWEYLSVNDASLDQLSGETLDDEEQQIMAGPEMYAALARLVPASKFHLFPLIYKILLKERVEYIQKIMMGGGTAQTLMNRIIDKAEQLKREYDEGLE